MNERFILYQGNDSVDGGSSTKIILDSATEIILKNVIKADISADDFVFV